MQNSFIQENTESRSNLEAIVSRLTKDDLCRSDASGWTVAALLAHLAFWDQRVIVLLKRWKENGVDASPVDANAVNDALKPLCLALDPTAAVELCLSSAREVDAELEAIGSKLMQDIQDSPNHFRFNRALHRRDHLSEIESLLWK